MASRVLARHNSHSNSRLSFVVFEFGGVGTNTPRLFVSQMPVGSKTFDDPEYASEHSSNSNSRSSLAVFGFR